MSFLHEVTSTDLTPEDSIRAIIHNNGTITLVQLKVSLAIFFQDSVW